jgi:hypothetical protein
VDRSKLPLSLLIALGLAPEACTTKDPKAHPCLSAPADDGKPPPDRTDVPLGPCLKVAPPPEVGPCLEVVEPPANACLQPVDDPPPTKEDPPVGPCLKVAPPDSPVGPCLLVLEPGSAPQPKKKKKGGASGGMASRSRNEIIERVRAALPPDVAARLPATDPDDA